MSFTYDPPPVLKAFMRDDDKRVRAVRGPVGSGKTTACVFELFRKATEAPPQSDGVRRSKMVITRNTLQQLKTTCLVSWMQMLRPVSFYKVSEQTIQLRMPGIECDIILLPLDSEQNIQRLLSLELTYAWASEFRELDPEVIQALLSRCGRYPSRAMLDPQYHDYNYGLIMETNSFSEDSPWYELLEVDLKPNWGYFIQPGAFSTGAENLENLPPNYYQDLMESNTPEWTRQYIYNEITPSLSGTAVFRSVFNSDFHISDSSLIPVPGHPLIIGMDTGREPAAAICQMDHVGRMLVLKTISESNMGMDKFLGEYLQPALQDERFAGLTGYIVLDPAARQRSQIGEESVLDCVKRNGFQAQVAMTNAIEPRLRAVEKFLVEQRNGGPALLIDPEACHDLVIAMQSRYRYKLKRDKTMEEKPEKNHPWSDVVDALQYACLGTHAGLRGRMMSSIDRTAREHVVSEPGAAGWT